jgi:phospholipid/cholesterol/gamma-HCH transport system substrate-binding protein
METRANYVLVGASVLAALATIVAFAFWLASSQFNQHEDTYYTYFTGSVTGLSSGGPVRYRGVPVGTVGQIEIDPDNIEQIRVTLKIKQGTPVKTDSIASLEVAGITGGSYVELTGGTRSSPLLIDASDGNIPVIKAENSSLEALVADAPKLLQKLNDLADRANEALSAANVKSISDTLGHIQNVAASVDSMTPELRETLTHFDQLAVDIHAKLPALLETAQRGGQSIKGASDEIHQLAASIDSVVAENRAPLHSFAANGLTELTGLITELQTLSDTLTRVADHLDRDPQRYLFGDQTNAGIDPNRPIGVGVQTRGAQ